jgi:hypothetical protein
MVINPAVQERAREILALAELRPIPLEVHQLLAAGEPIPKGIYDDFTMRVPMGFTVIFTHETQPVGLLKHLSMSVDLANRVPHPEAVRLLLEEFGFATRLEDCIVWQEDCGGGHTAINVIEPVDGDWEKLRPKT